MSDCASIRDRFFGAGALDRGAPELEAHLAGCPACRQAAQGLESADTALAELPRLAVAVPSFDKLLAPAATACARARRRRRWARRTLPFVLTGSAAAALAVLVLAGRSTSPERLLAEPGAYLEATAGARSAVLGSGARLLLDTGRVQLVAADDHHELLHLEEGALSIEAPKLPHGRSLAVRTPDAEVRVRGTRFRVARGGDGTSVSVIEGLVEVQPDGRGSGAIFVGPGESTLVQPLDRFRQSARSAALTALERGQVASAEAHLSRLLATRPNVPLAAEAQALLAWAAAARGDRRAAIEKYRQALAALPATERPLWADDACGELALLLEQEDPTAAAAAWRDYLERFPEGLHAALARARAAGSKEP